MTRTAPVGGSLDRQRAPRTAAWPLSPSEPRPPPPAPRPGAPGLQAWAADPSTSVTPWVAVSSQPRAADPPERGPLEDSSQSRCPEPAGVPARAPGGRARLLGLCAVPEGPPRPPSCPGSRPGAWRLPPPPAGRCPGHVACRVQSEATFHLTGTLGAPSPRDVAMWRAGPRTGSRHPRGGGAEGLYPAPQGDHLWPPRPARKPLPTRPGGGPGSGGR